MDEGVEFRRKAPRDTEVVGANGSVAVQQEHASKVIHRTSTHGFPRTSAILTEIPPSEIFDEGFSQSQSSEAGSRERASQIIQLKSLHGE